jgi:hypothetical protein
MKILKLISGSFVLAATLLAVSPSAYSLEAPAHPDKNLVTQQAIKDTHDQLQVAKKLLEEKGDFVQIDEALAKVRQSQKDVRFEATEHQRQKFNVKLKNAREAVDKKDNAAALTSLNEAIAIFDDIEKVYAAAHK